jgi:2'-5' RNA ligase
MRLFVAVWPSAEARHALAGLPRPEHPAVRWVPTEDLHVTLRFLGEVGDDAVPGVKETLGAVAARHVPRRVELGPSTGRLGRGVLMVPVAGLDDLGGAVAEATSGFGVLPPRRPFVGHVTLARARNRRSIPASLSGQPIEGAWVAGQLVLVRSHLGPAGARYEVVDAAALGGGQA